MQTYELLEHAWAKWHDLSSENMVVCNSGTAALHLALECVSGPGSIVAVPDFTMYACARACTLAGCTPYFVDCNERLLIDPVQIPGTVDTIMAVHIYGRRCSMDALHLHDKIVIEDMAEIHGTRPHPRSAAACWSFYKNKIVGGEEGGAVYFKDVACAEKARSLRTLGFTDAHDFTHIPRGHNYRMANVCAQLVLDNLRFYNRNLRKRRGAEEVYDSYLPVKWTMPEREQPWVYDFRIPGLSRDLQDTLVRMNRCHDIRHGFKPVSQQKEYLHTKSFNPHAVCASREVMYLPLNVGVAKAREAMERLLRCAQSLKGADLL